VKATSSTGLRQKYGQYMNKSSLTLGHVGQKLSEMSSKVGDGSNNTIVIPNSQGCCNLRLGGTPKIV
jgi:hypothetical protein